MLNKSGVVSEITEWNLLISGQISESTVMQHN